VWLRERKKERERERERERDLQREGDAGLRHIRREPRGHVGAPAKKVDKWLHRKGNSNSHGARLVHSNHTDDKVDSDQQVVNKELSLWRACVITPRARHYYLLFMTLEPRVERYKGL
jgi:hypothetical protein